MKTNDIGFKADYSKAPFTIEQIVELSGNTLLEFGTPWCGHCQAATPAIKEAFAEHSELRHIRIYDGKGKRLGRLFKVKLWPTLILLQDGNEVARLVRPLEADEVLQLLSKIS